MRFAFIARHRSIWPVAWLCDALDVSRSGFHAWLTRSPSPRSVDDEVVGAKVHASFKASDRTYGARRVWRDVLAGMSVWEPAAVKSTGTMFDAPNPTSPKPAKVSCGLGPKVASANPDALIIAPRTSTRCPPVD